MLRHEVAVRRLVARPRSTASTEMTLPVASDLPDVPGRSPSIGTSRNRADKPLHLFRKVWRSRRLVMGFKVSITISASHERVWEVLTDVERWPEWSPSMTKVTRFDSGPFMMGSQARIKQPRLSPMVWTVTEMTPGWSFVWENEAARSQVGCWPSPDE
jgi:Polyketide cyclase / dehydrase and lipid transport